MTRMQLDRTSLKVIDRKGATDINLDLIYFLKGAMRHGLIIHYAIEGEGVCKVPFRSHFAI